nr:MAG TPA: hypothetical protein [Caudoviricetes sp.]
MTGYCLQNARRRSWTRVISSSSCCSETASIRQ